MKKLIFLFSILSVLCSCSNHHTHVKDQHVKCYRQHIETPSGTEMLFWYLIWNSSGTSCYYYSSPTEITNYSSVQWQSSDRSPIAESSNIEEMPEQVVSEQNLSAEMQQEIDTHPEDFGGMTQEEMGDYEGGGTDNDGSQDGGSSDNGGGSGGDFDGGDGGGDGGGE